MSKRTSMLDDNNEEIFTGDILESKNGYMVLVCESDDGGFYGSLICSIEHSSRNIPYSLNNGKGHTILKMS